MSTNTKQLPHTLLTVTKTIQIKIAFKIQNHFNLIRALNHNIATFILNRLIIVKILLLQLHDTCRL